MAKMFVFSHSEQPSASYFESHIAKSQEIEEIERKWGKLREHVTGELRFEQVAFAIGEIQNASRKFYLSKKTEWLKDASAPVSILQLKNQEMNLHDPI